MNYREVAPPPSLSGHLACLWVQRVDADAPAHVTRVMPDGCIDIVWCVGQEPIVAGPDTRSWLVRNEPGTVMVGARFKPGLAPGLLGVASSELVNQAVPLADIWGSAAARRLSESDAAGLPQTMLAELADVLERRLPGAGSADPVVAHAVAWASAPHERPAASLGKEVGLCDRQLRRRVEERVGYGPTLLRRVLRFRRMLSLGPQRPLAELALEAGFADQAHLTRECLRLSGLTPRRLLSEVFNTGTALAS